MAEITGEYLNELISDEARKDWMEMQSEIRTLEKVLADRESDLENKLGKNLDLFHEILLSNVKAGSTRGDYQARYADDYTWMCLGSCTCVVMSIVVSTTASMKLNKRSQ